MAENYLDICMQLRKELEALPREYTRLMATRNWDVITDLLLNFNIGRLLIFMDNYFKGISDKIRITKFGVDGPATTAILYYDGNCIIYVVDGTRFPSDNFYTYQGNEITISKRYLGYNEIAIDYNLISLDGKEVTIITIWAGIKPEMI